MRTYELRKKEGIESSVYAIALVENPAIEVEFVYLSKEGEKKTYTQQVKLSEEEKILYSPLVIPNRKIYREDENGEGYEIYFSKETCREILDDFMAAQLNGNFNLEHDENNKIKDIHVVHSWIIRDPENGEAAKLGFKGLPEGTPMVGISLKRNPEALELVKQGKVKGISLEGLFDNYTVNFNNKEIQMEKNESTVDKILAKLEAIVSPKQKFAQKELANGGVVYTEGEFEDGVSVYVNEEMTEAAPDGEYELADGMVLTVVDGKAAGMREAAEEDMMKDKEMMSKVEELGKYVLSLVEKIDAVNERLESQAQTLSELKSNNEKLKEDKATVEAELKEIKETPVSKSVELSNVVEDKGGAFSQALNGGRMKLTK